MPYTAPLKSSLSAQHIEYSEPSSQVQSERPGLVRSASPRLQNSRSYSSTSYVRRHRRSPSISQSTVHSSSDPNSRTSPVIDTHASLRQSPPPVSNAAIPVGAMISPPESAPNSSDEESPYRGEGIKLEELEAAVRSISQRRESSPERENMPPAESMGTEPPSPSSSTMTLNRDPKPNHLRLSKSARKISHSRSSTETAIDMKRDEALTSSPDDSEDEMSSKPPMVRKKSGELVRPALRPARRRPSSMPGTPVYAKAVHFDSQLEHIRHFLQVDRPLAVSANTSPVETHDAEHEFPFGKDDDKPSWEWELRLSNAPKELPSSSNLPVQLERMFLSADKKVLIGTVAVGNLAFHKHVAARFTLDYWRTTSEVVAVFCHDVRRKHAHDGHDRFSFEIKLDDQVNLDSKTMFVCIRYNVNGQEFWDNNHGMNYQVDFIKAPRVASTKPSGGSRPTLPRSRTFATSHSARPRSMPPASFDEPSFDDFSKTGKNVGFSNPFGSSKGSPLNRALSDDIDTVGPPKRREPQNRQGFSNRYDFGASLTAAMKSKTPLDRTTLTARARSERPPGAKSVAEPVSTKASAVSEQARKEDLKPSSLVSSKPCLESSVYKELVDKYCFYGSPKSDETAPGPVLNVNSQEPSKQYRSGAPSPPLSPRSPAPLEAPTDASREPRPSNLAPVQASSPRVSPRTSPRASPSPMPFRYPYHQPLQNGFMKDPHSSPVIRG